MVSFWYMYVSYFVCHFLKVKSTGLTHISSGTLSKSLNSLSLKFLEFLVNRNNFTDIWGCMRIQWDNMYKALKRTYSKCSINVSFYFVLCATAWTLNSSSSPSSLCRGFGHKDQNPYESSEEEEWEDGLALSDSQPGKRAKLQCLSRQNQWSKQPMTLCLRQIVLLCRGSPRLPLRLIIH